MILVIGGLAAGKRAFVREKYGYEEVAFSQDPLDDCPVLYNLDYWVAQHPGQWEKILLQLETKAVVICGQVGSGLVPMDPEQRQMREEVGALSTQLAAAAQQVVRVCVGIPQWIKGQC